MAQTMRRLLRSRRDRVFAGICGGLAEYLGWDVVIVRVMWVALTILSAGVGIVLYLLAWFVVPLAEPASVESVPGASQQRSDTRAVLGVLAVAAGLLALGSAFLPWFWNISGFRVVGPVILIAIGAVLLLRKTSPEDGPVSSRAPSDDQSAAFAQSPRRRLVRIHRGRKIAGVCAGLGAYFDVDPTLVRLLWIVLLFAGGLGFLLYVLFWIAMPLVEQADDPAQ